MAEAVTLDFSKAVPVNAEAQMWPSHTPTTPAVTLDFSKAVPLSADSRSILPNLRTQPLPGQDISGERAAREFSDYMNRGASSIALGLGMAGFRKSTGAPTAPETAPPPAPAAEAASPAAPTEVAPAEPAPAKVTQAGVEQQVRESLGAPEPAKLEPGKPIYQRPKATPKGLPQDVPPMTPVTSSALKGYHYDAPSQTMTVQTNTGAMYRYGEVTPEEFKAFEGADSKGRAFQDIKNNHVGTGANYGQGWIRKGPTKVTVDPNAPTPNEEDLTPLLKKSLARFRAAQQGNPTE